MSKLYKTIVFEKEEFDDIKDMLDDVIDDLIKMEDQVEAAFGVAPGAEDVKNIVRNWKRIIYDQLHIIKEKIEPDETWLS